MGKVMMCKQCGKLFQSLGSSNCPVCVEEMDKAFKVVKEYLYDHEDATVLNVVKDTGVPEKYVLSFLKEGRLDIENSAEILKCEDCGKAITSGRYCISCRNKLANALENAIGFTAAKDKSGSDMRMQARMHSRYGRD